MHRSTARLSPPHSPRWPTRSRGRHRRARRSGKPSPKAASASPSMRWRGRSRASRSRAGTMSRATPLSPSAARGVSTPVSSRPRSASAASSSTGSRACSRLMASASPMCGWCAKVTVGTDLGGDDVAGARRSGRRWKHEARAALDGTGHGVRIDRHRTPRPHPLRRQRHIVRGGTRHRPGRWRTPSPPNRRGVSASLPRAARWYSIRSSSRRSAWPVAPV